MAKSINDLFNVGMGDEVFMVLKKEVFKSLRIVREMGVNSVAWKNLSEYAWDLDGKLRAVQNALSKMATHVGHN